MKMDVMLTEGDIERGFRECLGVGDRHRVVSRDRNCAVTVAIQRCTGWRDVSVRNRTWVRSSIAGVVCRLPEEACKALRIFDSVMDLKWSWTARESGSFMDEIKRFELQDGECLNLPLAFVLDDQDEMSATAYCNDCKAVRDIRDGKCEECNGSDLWATSGEGS